MSPGIKALHGRRHTRMVAQLPVMVILDDHGISLCRPGQQLPAFFLIQRLMIVSRRRAVYIQQIDITCQ